MMTRQAVSAVCRESLGLALAINDRHGGWLDFEKLRELRATHSKPSGCRGEVELRIRGRVESFSQEGWKVRMASINCQFTADCSSLPEDARYRARWRPHFDGEFDPQPLNGDLSILFLTSTFVGFSTHLCGQMFDNNSRFHFIAMLTAGAGASRSAEFALGKQLFNRQLSGMRH
jgi:hypothetical protein